MVRSTLGSYFSVKQNGVQYKQHQKCSSKHGVPMFLDKDQQELRAHVTWKA